MRLAVALALPLLLLPACGSDTPSDRTDMKAQAADTGGPKADTSAKVACRHFRNVMGDIEVLTAEELRKKVKEVADKASVSDVSGLPEHSRAMLVAATQDDGEGFMQSMGGMSAACNSVGQ